jgi:hypothetical protein
MNEVDQEQSEHGKRQNRADLVPVPFWTTPEARRQLRLLAAEEDTTQQKLIAEALNMLFEKRGRGLIA